MKKVLLINGSPHKDGCTFTALSEVARALETCGVSSEIVWIGKGAVHGCVACRACRELGRCVFDDDACNGIAQKLRESDGVVIGSPVYYAGANGALCALMDRVFYSSGARFDGKIGAAVVSCRRGGASATFDRLNKYFTISNMPIVPSQYWNSVHGNTPQEVLRDLEGLQTMRTLGHNMAWMLGALDGVPHPEREQKIPTNFIRE